MRFENFFKYYCLSALFLLFIKLFSQCSDFILNPVPNFT